MPHLPKPRHAYRSPRALADLPEEGGHMRSCTVLIRQRQRDTRGLVPRALALPEASWLALSAVVKVHVQPAVFLLPIDPLLLPPLAQAVETLLPFFSLLHQSHVLADEFVLPIDSLLQYMTPCYNNHMCKASSSYARRLLVATITTC